MKNNRLLGIHLRIKDNYTELLETAQAIGATSCQFFLTPQGKDKYVRLTKKDRETFLELRRKQFSSLYIHSSYWINPATGNETSSTISYNLLKKEMAIAAKLEIEFIVLHAGTAKKFEHDPNDPLSRQAGISALARILNDLLNNEHNITLLVENTAHDNKAVCSDLQDFITLRSLLTCPDRVKFCLDTAHAFAYGYNLLTTDAFVELLDQTMGVANIGLIHLNDSAKPCASKLDHHALPGKGLIGKKVLQKLINHPKLKGIPLIVEPPPAASQDMEKVINSLKECL